MIEKAIAFRYWCPVGRYHLKWLAACLVSATVLVVAAYLSKRISTVSRTRGFQTTNVLAIGQRMGDGSDWNPIPGETVKRNSVYELTHFGYPLPCSEWWHRWEKTGRGERWSHVGDNDPLVACFLMLASVLPVVGWHIISRLRSTPPAPAWVLKVRVYCWTIFGVAVGGIATAAVMVMALGWATDIWGVTPTHPLRPLCNFFQRQAEWLRYEWGWPHDWIDYSEATLLGMECGLVPGLFLIYRAKRQLRR